jgi:hypothetical protein
MGIRSAGAEETWSAWSTAWNGVDKMLLGTFTGVRRLSAPGKQQSKRRIFWIFISSDCEEGSQTNEFPQNFACTVLLLVARINGVFLVVSWSQA